MCWVMPPASPAVTSVSRIASKRLVFPWSTWPMTVTTGGRGIGGPSGPSRSSSSSSSGSATTTSYPSSSPRITALSDDMAILIVAISPRPISLRMMSVAGTFTASENSLTVMTPGISITVSPGPPLSLVRRPVRRPSSLWLSVAPRFSPRSFRSTAWSTC